MIQHELDHVFIGRFDGEPKINPDEGAESKFISVDVLVKAMEESPEQYTEWFKICFKETRTHPLNFS